MVTKVNLETDSEIVDLPEGVDLSGYKFYIQKNQVGYRGDLGDFEAFNKLNKDFSNLPTKADITSPVDYQMAKGDEGLEYYFDGEWVALIDFNSISDFTVITDTSTDFNNLTTQGIFYLDFSSDFSNPPKAEMQGILFVRVIGSVVYQTMIVIDEQPITSTHFRSFNSSWSSWVTDDGIAETVTDQSGGFLSLWSGTQAEYDALGSYDANTIYFTT